MPEWISWVGGALLGSGGLLGLLFTRKQQKASAAGLLVDASVDVVGLFRAQMESMRAEFVAKIESLERTVDAQSEEIHDLQDQVTVLVDLVVENGLEVPPGIKRPK